MKRLLAFMLILSLASVTNAGLQISVNGIPEPIDSQINICPSDILILDIWTNSVISPGVGEGYWALGCNPVDGTVTNGGLPTNVVPKYQPLSGVIGAINFEGGVFGGIVMTGEIPQIDAGDVIYDWMEFHTEGQGGDVVISLWFDIYSIPVLHDSVNVHVVPEPTSMLLLGLGGLLLRKRQR